MRKNQSFKEEGGRQEYCGEERCPEMYVTVNAKNLSAGVLQKQMRELFGRNNESEKHMCSG